MQMISAYAVLIATWRVFAEAVRPQLKLCVLGYTFRRSRLLDTRVCREGHSKRPSSSHDPVRYSSALIRNKTKRVAVGFCATEASPRVSLVHCYSPLSLTRSYANSMSSCFVHWSRESGSALFLASHGVYRPLAGTRPIRR